MLKLLWQLVLKDLKLFVADRKAMIISFAVPVVIASFVAMLNTGASDGKPQTKIKIAVSDQDDTPVSQQILARLDASSSVEPFKTDAATAKQWVDQGRVAYAVVLPEGFTKGAIEAMGDGNAKRPEMESIADPSKKMEAQIAKGAVMQAVMTPIVRAKYGAAAGDAGDRMPFQEKESAKPTSEEERGKWSGVAHAFAGMGVQGLLFWAIESAMGILRERRMGIWRRLRAAPVSPTMLMLGKILSGALRALMILFVVFGAGAAFFHMRIEGSVLGFLLIALGASIMAACFGLFVAALGKTEQQSRGLSILAVLAMTMLGGAWFPAFLMPKWVQTLGLFIPVRWAVDGFDAMTWRGENLSQALSFAGVLVAFAAVFGVIALRRIRWEYEA